jgi:uncharacterized membrane protein YuzA (DUF378 family)
MNLNIPKSSKEFYTQLSDAFFGQTAIDMRVCVVLTLALYFGTILIGNYTPYNLFWYTLGVPIAQWLFTDLRDVLVAMECTRLGFDILTVDPCLPTALLSPNYPRLWMAAAPLGLGGRDTEWLGITLSVLFFLCVLWMAGRLNFGGAVVYSLAVASPSVMLAIERNNVDVIIFILLCVALALLAYLPQRIGRAISYSIVFLTALLKLFPIFASAVLLRERKKIALGGLVGMAAVFTAYAVSIFGDLQKIDARVLRSQGLAYGRSIIPELFTTSDLFHRLFGFTLSPSQAMWLSVVGMASVLLIAYLAALVMDKSSTEGNTANFQLDAFRVGAAIYIGTFAIGNHIDYRLIFTLFTLPLLVAWTKHDSRWRIESLLGLLGLISTLYISRWSLTEDAIIVAPKYFIPDEIINWGLLGYFTYILLATLPEWAKQMIFPRITTRQNLT